MCSYACLNLFDPLQSIYGSKPVDPQQLHIPNILQKSREATVSCSQITDGNFQSVGHLHFLARSKAKLKPTFISFRKML